MPVTDRLPSEQAFVDVLLVDELLGCKQPDGPTADAYWVALTPAPKSAVRRQISAKYGAKVEAATRRCPSQDSSEWLNQPHGRFPRHRP